MTTIRFQDVDKRKSTNQSPYRIGDHNDLLQDCLHNKKFFDSNHDHILITSSPTPSRKFLQPYYGNGLLGTMFMSYSEHIPLLLRPDDLWIAILVNFGRYVFNHAEQVRDMFVNHQDKKELKVLVKSPYLEYTTEEQWNNFVGLMVEQIQQNTKSNVVQWMTPDFSTTTPRDRMVSNLAIMSTMREYFEMRFELSCGLSELTLAGTLDDWKQLYNKASLLNTFKVAEFDAWRALLLPVLQEFINAYQYQVNEDFWQKMCTSTRRGSGSQQKLRGWFLVFTPFNDEGKYLLNPLETVSQTGIYAALNDDQIPDCGLNVNVEIDDHDREYHVVFYGGLLLTQYDHEKNCLAPSVDWVMIEKTQLTYDNLAQQLQETKYDRGNRTHFDETTQRLLRTAHQIALKSNVPNDLIHELPGMVVSYYYNYTHNVKPTTDYDHGFLTFLSQKYQMYHPNIFYKYIKRETLLPYYQITGQTCLKGHQLTPCTAAFLCSENPGYSQGFRCDICGTISQLDVKSPTLCSSHCSQCGFDVCSSCLK